MILPSPDDIIEEANMKLRPTHSNRSPELDYDAPPAYSPTDASTTFNNHSTIPSQLPARSTSYSAPLPTHPYAFSDIAHHARASSSLSLAHTRAQSYSTPHFSDIRTSFHAGPSTLFYNPASPYAPSRTPALSSSSKPSSRNDPEQHPEVLSNRAKLAPGESISLLLDPPPPSFNRSPAPDASYPPFEATALMGISNDLTTCFPLIAPPSTTIPHPFFTHDVNEQDWVRFLNDIRAAGLLAPSKSIVANVAPIARHLPPLMGMLATKGIELHLKGKRKGPIGDLISYWNHHFFNPRHLDVVLAQGVISYSGCDSMPPDTTEKALKSRASDDTNYDYQHNRFRDSRGRNRIRPKLRKSDILNSTDENWRLVVAFKL
ncbi:uncharacterized protein FIBRA_00034 [Fibroporia radiculosa]|uniref:Spondin domain-containing protein n=1 Tax=Fibroporia radiculosa TaxID=599839 RepID=J7RUP9_9APHY|nr:uncharacterized protein FIBRA_00034 [Fibroporia radiculosa]CCL98040.1 predicted protein [Fibroporia radiculosa]